MSQFVEQLAMADEDERQQVISELPEMFFSAISQPPLANKIDTFLESYEAYVERKHYSFEHAETIAKRMNRIFKAHSVPAVTRAKALDLAVRAAFYMNRFAAMDSCRAMVRSVSEQELALHVVPIILKPEADFLGDVEPSSCSNDAIRNAIRTIHNREREA